MIDTKRHFNDFTERRFSEKTWTAFPRFTQIKNLNGVSAIYPKRHFNDFTERRFSEKTWTAFP